MQRRHFLTAAALACVIAPPALIAQSPSAEPVRLLLYGDSLLAGYGLSDPDSFEGQLAAALAAAGRAVRISNASVSGDTSAGGLARLDWTLADPVDAALLCLGGNDGLRGLDPLALERNLDAMITRLRARKIQVLLAGMRAPRNLGPDYTGRFDALYPRLAATHALLFYPFILDGVAADPALNQSDGIHPNAAGVARMVAGMLPLVTRLLDAAASPGRGA